MPCDFAPSPEYGEFPFFALALLLWQTNPQFLLDCETPTAAGVSILSFRCGKDYGTAVWPTWSQITKDFPAPGLNTPIVFIACIVELHHVLDGASPTYHSQDMFSV